MHAGGRQAGGLASRFRAENEALLALVSDLTEHEWAMDCPDEGRSVGVVVQHIAEGHWPCPGSTDSLTMPPEPC